MQFEKNKAYISELLLRKAEQYNRPDFIKDDPIQIPKSFSKLQDIEISGLMAAVLAWGQRKTIIRKTQELMQLMDNAPHDFVLNHQTQDLKRFLGFKHRTFQTTDLLYFIEFFKTFYQENHSLESLFAAKVQPQDANIGNGLIHFHDQFFSLPDSPARTRKHIATPMRKSACKRLNMYLRWLVRKDEQNVDFGLWKSLKMSQLVCPLDVHVERVARHLGLLTRPQTDWQAAVELTENLRKIDPNDPVRFDFALFGLGLEGFV